MGYRLMKRKKQANDRDLTRSARAASARRAAMKTAAVLPTACTLGNLVCGFLAIFIASRPPESQLIGGFTPLAMAAALVFVGMIFDGLDGSIARMARATSDIGEQLDSMADMVTFGIAPAFIAVQLVGIETPYFGQAEEFFQRPVDRIVLVVACIYTCCAALRLARFNTEIDQPGEADHMSFKGLPSPGAAGTVASLVLLHQYFLARPLTGEIYLLSTAVTTMAIMGLVAFAMVSRFRYPHFANRFVRGRAPLHRIVTGLVVIFLLSVWPQPAIATAFVIYALSAPVWWVITWFNPNWRRGSHAAKAAGEAAGDEAVDMDADLDDEAEMYDSDLNARA